MVILFTLDLMFKFNIMKKNILVFVFLVFSFLNGQNNKNIDFNSLPVKESNNSLLFKIEKDNKINYMFGTMHLMCESEMKYKNLLNSLIKELTSSFTFVTVSSILAGWIRPSSINLSKETFATYLLTKSKPEITIEFGVSSIISYF